MQRATPSRSPLCTSPTRVKEAEEEAELSSQRVPDPVHAPATSSGRGGAGDGSPNIYAVPRRDVTPSKTNSTDGSPSSSFFSPSVSLFGAVRSQTAAGPSPPRAQAAKTEKDTQDSKNGGGGPRSDGRRRASLGGTPQLDSRHLLTHIMTTQLNSDEAHGVGGVTVRTSTSSQSERPVGLTSAQGTSPTSTARLYRSLRGQSTGNSSIVNSPANTSAVLARLAPLSPASEGVQAMSVRNNSVLAMASSSTTVHSTTRRRGTSSRSDSPAAANSSHTSMTALSPVTAAASLRASRTAAPAATGSPSSSTPGHAVVGGGAAVLSSTPTSSQIPSRVMSGWYAGHTSTTPTTTSANSRSNSMPRSYSSVVVEDASGAQPGIALPSLPVMPVSPVGSRHAVSPVWPMSTLDGAPALSPSGAPPTSPDSHVFSPRQDPAGRASGVTYWSRGNAWSDGQKRVYKPYTAVDVARGSSSSRTRRRVDSSGRDVMKGEEREEEEERPRAGTASAIVVHSANPNEWIGRGRLGGAGAGLVMMGSHAQTPKAPGSAHTRFATTTTSPHGRRESAAVSSVAFLGTGSTSARWPVARPHFVSSMAPSTTASTGGEGVADTSVADLVLPVGPDGRSASGSPLHGGGGGLRSHLMTPVPQDPTLHPLVLSPPPLLLSTLPGRRESGVGCTSPNLASLSVSLHRDHVEDKAASLPRPLPRPVPNPSDAGQVLAHDNQDFLVSCEWRSPFQSTPAPVDEGGEGETCPVPGVSSHTAAQRGSVSTASVRSSHNRRLSSRLSAVLTTEERRSSAASTISLSSMPMYVAGRERDVLPRGSGDSGGSHLTNEGPSRLLRGNGSSGASHSIPAPPWSPEEALVYHAHCLTPFEKEEIHDYSAIYYCGERAVRLGLKHTHAATATASSHTSSSPAAPFDEEDKHYRVIIGDHIAYRYEVIDVLGYGTYSVVVRVVDHACEAAMTASRSTLHPASDVHGAPLKPPRVLAMKIIRNDPQYTAVAEEEVRLHNRLKQSFHIQRHESFRLLKRRASSVALPAQAPSLSSWRTVAGGVGGGGNESTHPVLHNSNNNNNKIADSPRKRRAPEVQLASFALAEARLQQDAEQGRCTLSQLISHFSFRSHLILVFPLFGMDLGELLRINNRNPFPIIITRSFVAQAAHALASIRRAGILHADIKPENILLVDRSEEDAELPTFSSCIAKMRDGGCAVGVDNSFNDSESIAADRLRGEGGGGGSSSSGSRMDGEARRTDASVSVASVPETRHRHRSSHSMSSPPPPPRSNSVTASPLFGEAAESTASEMAADVLIKVSTDSAHALLGRSLSPTPPPPTSSSSRSQRSAATTPTVSPQVSTHPPPSLAPSTVTAPVSLTRPASHSRPACASSSRAERRTSMARVSSRITLIDFSNARPSDAEHCLFPIQSQFYRSPEAALRLHYDERMDMWSLGCIVYELVTGHTLFPVNSDVELLNHALELLGMPDRVFLDRIKSYWKAYRASHPHVGPIRSETSPSASPSRPTQVRVQEGSLNEGSVTVDEHGGEARSKEDAQLETCWQALLHMLNRKAAANANGNGSRDGDDDTIVVSILAQLGEVDLLLADELCCPTATPPSADPVMAAAAAAAAPASGTEELVLLLLDFLLGCLFWDSEARLRPEEALRHPFLSAFFLFPTGDDATATATAAARPLPLSESRDDDDALCESRTCGVYFLRLHTLTAQRMYLLGRAKLYAGTRAATAAAAAGQPTALDQHDDSVQRDVAHKDGEHTAVKHAQAEHDKGTASLAQKGQRGQDGEGQEETERPRQTVPLEDLCAEEAEESGEATSSSASSRSLPLSSAQGRGGARTTAEPVPLPILLETATFFPLSQPPVALPGEERFLCAPAAPQPEKQESRTGGAAAAAAASNTISFSCHPGSTVPPTAAELLLHDLGTPQDCLLSPGSVKEGSQEMTPLFDRCELSGRSQQASSSSRSQSAQNSPALARTLPTRYSRLMSDLSTPALRGASLASSFTGPSALHIAPSSLQLTTRSNTTSLHHHINQQVLRSTATTPREVRPLPASTPPALGVALPEGGSPQVLILDLSGGISPPENGDSSTRPKADNVTMRVEW